MADLKADDTGNAIVPVLACVLNQLCLRNDRLPMSQKGLSKFHALRPPAISIKDYLQRVAKYAACSGECFVLALVYIDRIIQSNPTFVVNSLNIHRLLITSIMLAAKFFDDQVHSHTAIANTVHSDVTLCAGPSSDLSLLSALHSSVVCLRVLFFPRRVSISTTPTTPKWAEFPAMRSTVWRLSFSSCACLSLTISC